MQGIRSTEEMDGVLGYSRGDEKCLCTSTEHEVLTIWTGAAECRADNVPVNASA